MQLLELIWNLLTQVASAVARLEAASTERRLGVRLAVDTEPNERIPPMSLSLAMNNRQRCRVDLVVPVTDQDGQAFPEGFAPAIAWESREPSVTDFVVDEGGNGSAGYITSGAVGVGSLVVRVGPYTDGTTLAEEINVSVGNSGPGPLSLSLGAVEDEPAAEAPPAEPAPAPEAPPADPATP